MISKKIAKDLEDIIENGIRDLDIPHVSQNSIRIKNYVIRKNKKGEYNIFDISENRRLFSVNFKYTAIALTKALIKGKSTNRILQLDADLLKHYNDSLFYKNSMINSKDSSYREVREIRLDIAHNYTKQIKRQLESYIFG